MCSLSGSWDLAGRHPEVRLAILDQSLEPLAANLGLGMSLFLGPRFRIIGPTLQVTPSEGLWQWVIEFAFSPFAFLMVLASNQENPGRGLMMNDWVMMPSDSPHLFEGVLQVGFGWVPYPGDYRSQAALRADVVGENIHEPHWRQWGT